MDGGTGEKKIPSHAALPLTQTSKDVEVGPGRAPQGRVKSDLAYVSYWQEASLQAV